MCLIAWCEVEGEILQTEQQPANAEARAQATELLRELHAQRDGKPLVEAPIGKPLVEAPEFGDRVRDTNKEPYWIPGAFPNDFQHETGDLPTTS